MVRTISSVLATTLLVSILVPPAAGAQSDDALTRAEVAKLFDAYAVVQAQEQLALDEAQYGRFVPRYRALVDVRRRALAERQRTVQELNRLTKADVSSVDESRVRELISQLADIETRAAGDVQKATVAIDEVLTVRQQGRFRVFEEQMERRKVELLARARQNAKPAPPRPRP